MAVKQIIDTALSQGDNVPESDAGYIDRRRRALTFLRDVFQECWWTRDWPFKRGQLDVTVLAGLAYVNVPSDFNSLGAYGGIYRLVSGVQQFPPLEEVPESRVMEYRSGAYTTSVPRIFAFFGQDPVDHRLRIQVPQNDVDVALRVFYQKRPPKLWDVGDPEPLVLTLGITRVGQVATATSTVSHGLEMFDRVVVSGATQPEYNGTFEITVTGDKTFTYTVSGTPATPATGTPVGSPDVAFGNLAILQIPEDYHLKVLLVGLKAKLRESKGDARWSKLESDYQMGLTAMRKETNRFQAEVRQLPSFFGDRNPSGIN